MKRNLIFISVLLAGLLSGQSALATGEHVTVMRNDSFDPELPPAPKAQPVKKVEKKSTAELVDSVDPVPISDRARYEASKRWVNDGAADALIGTNGMVEFAYGQSRPTVTCAPLHLCAIQLLPGENVSNMAIGDSVRWMVQQATAGDRPVVVVKPTQAGLNTNLTVMTDAGRLYYMTLVSTKSTYVPLVGFYDPQALVVSYEQQAADARSRKALQQAQADAALKAAEDAHARRVAAIIPADFSKLDFEWNCNPNGEAGKRMLPARVFSGDGHVHIQMPPTTKVGDAPAVFNVSGGDMELLNFRISGSYYILDGEPSKIKLISGNSKKMASVLCEHTQKKTSSWLSDSGSGWAEGASSPFPGVGGLGR